MEKSKLIEIAKAAAKSLGKNYSAKGVAIYSPGGGWVGAVNSDGTGQGNEKVREAILLASQG